ncbi:hypothetical protein SAMN04487965_1501 [Microbulbifer donghaiensis]|uniref:Uncharacterized protein n=1 Tax=Microbulbifer donghaiensis TaxID=494016 RepID=A0A1M4ZCQ7_9GAMM|nr:hypothetical protein [Microbulbifer donghaiensis]SHF15562.1 hypothetical protein SAMN04487965_1501 [Microbulbifer donghaiensis]
MTTENILAAAPVEVPKNGKVTVNYTLKPTGPDQKWAFKDSSGEDAETIHLQFLGVKDGGTGVSGKATLVIELVETDLVFADKQDTADKKYDGMEICGETDGGTAGIKKAKKMNGSPQFLEIEVEAPGKDACSFSFKWAAEDASGNLVLSADPDMQLDPQ